MAEMTREAVAALILARLPDNASRFISPARLRDVVSALADSALFKGEAASADAIASAIAAAASAYATAAQGAKADSAVQPDALAAANRRDEPPSDHACQGRCLFRQSSAPLARATVRRVATKPCQ